MFLRRQTSLNGSICRLCLEEKAQNYVFDNDVAFNTIMEHFRLDIHHDDGLPDYICNKCTLKVEDISKFIKLCSENDKILRQKIIIDDPTRNDEYTNNSVDSYYEDTSLSHQEKNDCIEISDEKLMESVKTSENGEEYLYFRGIKIIVNRSLKIISNETKKSRQKEAKYFCEICGQMKRRGHHQVHKVVRDHKCEICDKAFRSKYNLKSHINLHSDERPFKCKLCEKASKTESGLRKHVKFVHNASTTWQPCKICHKKIRNPWQLTVHERNHTKEKKFECDVCQYRCLLKRQLETHMRTHTGEKPYSCKFCQKSFALTTTLQEHVRLHNGERPYVCSVCKKGFAQLGNMKSHFRHNHRGVKFEWIPLNQQRKLKK